jgi:hypothetical protein
MIIGVLMVGQATVRGSGEPFALRMSAALVAATLGFVLDDAAASTLASSPTTLAARRAVRVLVTASPVVAWYIVVERFVGSTPGTHGPFDKRLLEMGALTLVSLATAALAARVSDDGRGGIAGTVVAMLCFGSAFLEPRWWWPLPPDPSAPGAIRRLVVVCIIAGAGLAYTSLDPALRRRLRRRSRHRDVVSAG